MFRNGWCIGSRIKALSVGFGLAITLILILFFLDMSDRGMCLTSRDVDKTDNNQSVLENLINDAF